MPLSCPCPGAVAQLGSASQPAVTALSLRDKTVRLPRRWLGFHPAFLLQRLQPRHSHVRHVLGAGFNCTSECLYTGDSKRQVGAGIQITSSGAGLWMWQVCSLPRPTQCLAAPSFLQQHP